MRSGVCVALVLVLATSSVRADPTPTEIQAARELFAKAEKDEDAGQWSEALDKLRRAASVKVTPGIRFHIALCEEKLNQLVAALADYVAADQDAHEQNNKDVIEAVADPLRTLRIRVPTLTITVPQANGAHVELDGKEIAQGLYGAAMPVEPGMHRVQARASGKRPFTTQVQLSEREAETTTVKWLDIAQPNEGGATLDARETPPASDQPHAIKWAAIVTTTLAVATLGFGIGAYVAAGGAQQTLFQQCSAMPDCSGLRTTVRAWDAVALASWIASAGLTTLAVVLWLKPSTKVDRVAIELRPGGLALAGSF